MENFNGSWSGTISCGHEKSHPSGVDFEISSIFDLVFVITRGGPGTATLVASVYDYTIFQAGRLGVMAAYGFLILIVINLVVILFLRLLYRQEKEARQVQKA